MDWPYALSAAVELPPRARRILRGTRACDRTTGTTSACAENTLRNWPLDTQLRNYLRVRGEYISATYRDSPSMELPPRARRIPNPLLTERKNYGTTSACAENTEQSPAGKHTTGNYLRVRGEYRANIEWDIRRYGTTSACAENTVSKSSTAPTVMELPPRARRIRGSPYIGSLYGGTTSACAENTVGFHWCGFPPWNYLRVRGEYTFIDGESGEELELPPRARRIH